MKKSSQENQVAKLTALATKKLSQLSGKTFVQLHPHAEFENDKGENVFLFSAHATDDANGKTFEVAFTADGKELPATDLEKMSMPSSDVLEVNRDLLFPFVRGTEPISISPKINELILKECERFDEEITVTVPKNSKRQIDVYFLADTTGSMSAILNAVKAGANNIFASISALGHDIAYGVGNYKDFKSGDSYAFDHQLSPTTSTPAVTAAINTWSASGGADQPEGQLFALDQLAEAPAGSIGWRNGSKRIIVWFGDEPAHDPVCASISGLSYDISEGSVTSKLVSEKITVLAISVGSNNLNGDPVSGSFNYGSCVAGGSAGQAVRITSATGGSFSSGINTTNIVNTIISIINAAVSVIGNLSLIPSGGTAPFVSSITPETGYGPLSGDFEHILKFKVRFTGVKPCDSVDQDFYGTLDVVADGAVVASKKVHITVPACCKKRRYSYSVKFVIGQQERTECLSRTQVNNGSYTTEVNIHNYQNKDAVIEKYFTPVVLMGKPIGREPEYSKPMAKDKIVLPPLTATMDDNYRILNLLYGAEPPCETPICIGFLHIISSIELAVTAVYTVSDMERKGNTSIAVEQINAKEIPLEDRRG